MKNKINFESLTETQLEELLDSFEDTLFNSEMTAEWEIEDFDANDSNHWDQMKDLAIEITREQYLDYGYTEEDFEFLLEAYHER